MMRINKKANRSGISALIPIYNCVVLMEVINEPKWKALLLLIPGVNIIYFCIAMHKLAKCFRKDPAYCILTAIFPLIMVPILGFGNSEYIGINEEAMKGVSIAKDLPVETSKKPTLSNPDQPLKERTKVNMSIGGGVYQKQYRDSLLEAKHIKEVKKPDVADFRVNTNEISSSNSSKDGIDLFQNVTFVESENKKRTSDSPSSIPNNSPMNLLSQNESMTIPVIPNDKPLKEETQVINFSSFPNSNLVQNKNGNTNVTSPPTSVIDIVKAEVPQDGNTKPSPDISTNTTNFIPTPVLQPSIRTTEEAISPTVNPALQGIGNPIFSQDQFIACPHCGAKVKSGSPKCFMCGKELQ